ncbi:MAG: lysophospholipid acyltransferase family protein [Pseudomonadota bacterium]
MQTLDQITRYLIAAISMPVFLGGAILIAPVSANWSWHLVRFWNRLVLAIFGIEYEVRFESEAARYKDGGVVVGLTQQSILDPTVGYAAWDRPVKSIWNIEYALIPFFGWVTFTLGWIIVRQWPAQAKRQIEKAAQYAANGGLVYLSAEGQRSDDGKLQAYKKGPVVMAIQAQVPLYPTYIAGSRSCLTPGEWRIRPGKIVIHNLSPISTEGYQYKDRDELFDKIRQIGEREHAKWSAVSEDQW